MNNCAPRVGGELLPDELRCYGRATEISVGRVSFSSRWQGRTRSFCVAKLASLGNWMNNHILRQATRGSMGGVAVPWGPKLDPEM